MKVRVSVLSLLIVAIASTAWWLGRQVFRDDDIAVNPVAEEQHGISDRPSEVAPIDEKEAGVSEQQVELSVAQIAQDRRDRLVEKVLNEELRWIERVEAMKALGDDPLDQETVSRLYAYLRSHPEGNAEDFYVVGNEIMEVFREQRVDAETYYREMLRLIEDPEAKGVMRDYAIQHLTKWHEFGGLDQEEIARRDEAFERMLSVIEKPENASADFVGTAFTALYRGLMVGEFEKEDAISARLEALVLETARGRSNVSSINRLTALQVATEMELSDAADISRGILSQKNGDSEDMRLSAIASLGLVGDMDDLPRIAAYEGDERLGYAVQSAKKRISEKYSKKRGNN